MKKLKKPLIILFILTNLYTILCGGLYFFQENLIFHPQKLPTDYRYEFDTTFEEITLESNDRARLNGLHFKVNNPKGVILYYHGNAGSLLSWGKIAQFFVQKQYDVVIMDYRQFGKSEGNLSEDYLYEDSMTWYEYTKKAYPNTEIIVYGRSLGTTFATYVASKNQIDKLVLETPFYSLEEEASSRFSFLPVKKLLNYRFATYQYVNSVTSPIIILHGTEDKVVAYDHGKRLFDSITQSQKEFITVIGGGHNNLINFTAYTEAIDNILKKE